LRKMYQFIYHKFYVTWEPSKRNEDPKMHNWALIHWIVQRVVRHKK
jgi:hypothetical protein